MRNVHPSNRMVSASLILVEHVSKFLLFEVAGDSRALRAKLDDEVLACLISGAESCLFKDGRVIKVAEPGLSRDDGRRLLESHSEYIL